LLEALQDARLLFSAEKKQVFIKTKDGKLLDAATGKSFAGEAPADIDTVIVNNRLRNSISAALGGLTLMAADPNRRYDAGQAVFRSREQSALPALEAALAKETDARVKKAQSLGATLMRPIFDVPGVGRIAILKEPGGAGIGWMTPV